MLKRTFLFLFPTLFIFFSPYFSIAQHIPFEWVRADGGYDSESWTDIFVEAGGGFIVTGHSYSDTVRIGTTQVAMPPANWVGAITTKFDSLGQALWTLGTSGSSMTNTGEAVTGDQQGNIFVTIAFFDTLIVSNDTFVAPNQEEVVLLKYDPMGNLLWGREIGNGILSVEPGGLAADERGNVYLAGRFTDTLDLVDTLLVNMGPGFNQDNFVVCYDPNGTVKWAQSMGSPGNDLIRALAWSSSGALYLTGTHRDSFYVGGNMLSTGGAYSGAYFVKMDSLGNTIWAKTFQGTGSAFWGTHLAADSIGNCYFGLRYSGQFTINSTTITAPTASVDMEIIKFNPNGSLLWYQPLYSSQLDELQDLVVKPSGDKVAVACWRGTTNIGAGVIVPPKVGGFVSIYDSAGSIQYYHASDTAWAGINAVGFRPGDGYYAVGSGSFADVNSMYVTTGNNTSDFLIFSSLDDFNTILGSVFRDFNGNGIKDPGDYGYSDVMVLANSGPYAGISRMSGDYWIFPDSGTFVQTIPTVPPYYTLLTPSNTSVFSGYRQVDMNQDFALEPIPGIEDLEVCLSSVISPRAAGVTIFDCLLRNVGPDTLFAAELVMKVDSNFNVNSAAVPWTAYAGDSVSWVIPSLRPGGVFQVRIDMLADSTVAVGDISEMELIAYPISTDTTPGNNHIIRTDTVRGAYDPNDKQVNTTQLTPAQLAEGAGLTYTIRFQNTGNDTAFTVVIRDTLDPNADLNSLRTLSASHPFRVTLHNRGIQWRFDNILLPDSSTDFNGSCGFVTYSVNPRQGLVLGDQILNNASIYFDNNPPIVTNTVTTTIDTIFLVGRDPEQDLIGIQVVPNPNQGKFNLALSLDTKQEVQIQVIDLFGEVLYEGTKSLPQGHHRIPIDHSSFASGVYLLRVQAGKTVQVARMLLQK